MCRVKYGSSQIQTRPTGPVLVLIIRKNIIIFQNKLKFKKKSIIIYLEKIWAEKLFSKKI